jgi:hypothetical protein
MACARPVGGANSSYHNWHLFVRPVPDAHEVASPMVVARSKRVLRRPDGLGKSQSTVVDHSPIGCLWSCQDTCALSVAVTVGIRWRDRPPRRSTGRWRQRGQSSSNGLPGSAPGRSDDGVGMVARRSDGYRGHSAGRSGNGVSTVAGSSTMTIRRTV